MMTTDNKPTLITMQFVQEYLLHEVYEDNKLHHRETLNVQHINGQLKIQRNIYYADSLVPETIELINTFIDPSADNHLTPQNNE